MVSMPYDAMFIPVFFFLLVYFFILFFTNCILSPEHIIRHVTIHFPFKCLINLLTFAAAVVTAEYKVQLDR